MSKVPMLAFLIVGSACSGPQPPPSPEPNPDPPASAQPSASPSPSASATAAQDPFGDVDEIVFGFHDASVPPQYHRSYTIRVTATEIQKTVDSYGKIISDDKAPLTQAEFEAIRQAIAQHAVKFVPDGASADPGCAGGTARSLTLKSKGKTVVEGRLEKCGGTESGTLAGDLDAFQKTLGAKAPSRKPSE